MTLVQATDWPKNDGRAFYVDLKYQNNMVYVELEAGASKQPMRAYLNSNMTTNVLVSKKCGNGALSKCVTDYKYDTQSADIVVPDEVMEIIKVNNEKSENKFIKDVWIKGREVLDFLTFKYQDQSILLP